MNEDQLYAKLLSKEVGVSFSDIDAFRIFCAFLRSKGVCHKQSVSYYWEKYKNHLCVTISELGNFKCGSTDFYEKEGRQIYLYDKKPYIVDIVEEIFYNKEVM